MELVFIFFKLISTLITDLLYEKSMVNNLFSFDLEKKKISIKVPKIKEKNEEKVVNKKWK